MKFTLPKLPYAFDALEPYIDAKTMEIHYTKHHQAYINNLEAALEKHPEFDAPSAEALLRDLGTVPDDIRTTVRNNAGGDFNHSLFWQIMKKNGGGEPNGKLAEEIKKSFGSFKQFQDLFNDTAKKVFGSGWSWLSLDNQGKLTVTGLPNQDSPLLYGSTPIMGLDVWEHAYYLKYQNKRPDYISAWWHVIDWDRIEGNYHDLIG